MKSKYTPDLQAQVYAMIDWNGKTMAEAEAVADETLKKHNGDAKVAFDELDASVYAGGSVLSAINGIMAHEQELKGDGKYDAIIKILSEIHDTWVAQNTKKYDRGNPEKSAKQIFQHLPLELIGVDEVAKDLMFLAPFLKEQGIEVGQMQEGAYGAFVPSAEVVAAYNRAVEAYKSANNIQTIDDLHNALPQIIENYAPLQTPHEKKDDRLGYMLGKVGLITNTVVSKQDKDMFIDQENYAD